MLPALLTLATAVLPQDPARAAPTSREDAWALVRAAGYEVAIEGPDAVTGALVHGKGRAFVSLARTVGDPAKGVPDTYPYLSVVMEWATPKEIDPDEFDRWSAKARPGARTSFTPHLGRTASVWAYFPLADAKEPQGLRADLDAFWADAERLAAHYGAKNLPVPAPEPKGLRFDPRLRLKRADDTSLRRVFDSWGWHADETANALVGGWGFPIRVGGRLLWARGTMDGQSYSTRRFTVERLAAQGTTPLPSPIDVAKLGGEGPGVYYGGAFHPREARLAFDLARPLPLSELRRRVEAFTLED